MKERNCSLKQGRLFYKCLSERRTEVHSAIATLFRTSHLLVCGRSKGKTQESSKALSLLDPCHWPELVTWPCLKCRVFGVFHTTKWETGTDFGSTTTLTPHLNGTFIRTNTLGSILKFVVSCHSLSRLETLEKANILSKTWRKFKNFLSSHN